MGNLELEARTVTRQSMTDLDLFISFDLYLIGCFSAHFVKKLFKLHCILLQNEVFIGYWLSPKIIDTNVLML